MIVFAHTFVEPAGAQLTQVASPEWHNGHEVHPIGQAQMASDGTITEDLLIRDEIGRHRHDPEHHQAW